MRIYNKAHKSKPTQESEQRRKRYMAEYREVNKDRIKEKNRQYYESIKDTIREERKQYYKKYYGLYSGYNKLWKEQNREKVLLYKVKYNNKRRAALLETEHRVTTQQLNSLIEESGNKCFWCDKEIDVMNFDHIYPLSKGGKDEINNIVVSCQSCNQRKNAKDPDIWLDEILTKKVEQN